MAQIPLIMGETQEALHHLQHCLRLSPDSVKTIFMLGIALNLNGDWQPAENFLQAVLDRYPNDQHALLWMIDCQLRRLDETAAGASAFKFLEGVPLNQVQSTIDRALDDNVMPDDSKERLPRWIVMQAKNLDPGSRSASTFNNDGTANQRHDL